MAHLTLLLVVSFACCALSGLLIKDNAWHAWKQYHNKMYTSDDEESLRYTIWNNNLKKINQHNSETRKAFTLEMNHLGDMVYILFLNSFLQYVRLKFRGVTFVLLSSTHLLKNYSIPHSVQFLEKKMYC